MTTQTKKPQLVVVGTSARKSLASEVLGVLFGPSTKINSSRTGTKQGHRKTACNCDGDRKR